MTTLASSSAENIKNGEQRTSQEDFPHAKAGRIKFVTKILMDSKYGLMDDLNYTRGFPEHNDILLTEEIGPDVKIRDHAKNSTEIPTPVICIPRSARIKADRVRIYLDYYYSLLERSINIESPEHHHEGVEGIYNPLQIIRNRTLRKKYHELPPRELFIQKAPVIAIKQFSKKVKKKMPWYVDISERSSDLTWRTSHWDELVGPRGNLWFPRSLEPENSTLKESNRHLRPQVRRLQSASSGLAIDSPYSTGGLNSSSPEFAKSIKKSTSESNLSKPLGLSMSKPEYGDHILPSEESEKSRSNRFESIIGKKSKRWSRSPHARRKSPTSIDKLSLPSNTPGRGSFTTRTPAHSRRSSTSLIPIGYTTYMTPVDDTGQRSTLLGALPIQHVRKHSIDQTEEEQIENVKDVMGEGSDFYADSIDPLDEDESLPQTDEQLQNYWKNTRYIIGTLKIMQHRRITHNIVRKRGIERRDRFHYDQKMDDIILETTDVLDTYDKELNRALKKGNSLASKMLNDYSMRVETLISTSDRILSDINTTLTLKLKLFQEDADKFGSLKGMKAQRFTKALYRILEYAIVLILWTIWFIVSIIRWIKFSVLLIFKFTIWMLW